VRSIRYLDAARDEFLHEVAYFTAVSPALGRRFDEAVQRAEALIAEFAEMGSPFKFGTRRVFTFAMVYLVRPDEVLVIALAPFKRKPGYWRHRIAKD
jgi:toxin ParE1/3/4